MVMVINASVCEHLHSWIIGGWLTAQAAHEEGILEGSGDLVSISSS